MKNYDRIFVIVLDSLGIGQCRIQQNLVTSGWILLDIFLRKWVLWRFQILETGNAESSSGRKNGGC